MLFLRRLGWTVGKRLSKTNARLGLGRVQNGPRKTGQDQQVSSKVKSSLMVEIRPTGWSGLADKTNPGLV